MNRLKSATALVGIAAAALGGCSGGGAGTVAPPSVPNSSTGPAASHASATFTVVIPKRIGSSAVRRPKYVSTSTQSLVVTLTAVNGTAVASPTPYAVNVGGASCATPGANGTTCTVGVPATPGTDTFAISAYDAVQTSLNPTSPAGNVLSMQSANVTIAANTANAVSMTLDGVVASFTMTSTQHGYIWFGSQTIPLTIQPYDADGNLIVGPGSLRNATGSPFTIGLTDSDGSGVTTLPATTVTAATLANAAFTYTGRYLASAATITATASGYPAASVSFNATLKSGTMFLGSPSGTKVIDTTVSPVAVKSTIGTGRALAVALDANDNLYQGISNTGVINKYTLGATTVSSTLTGAASPVAFALDSTGRLYVANDNNPPVYFNSGATAATGTISGSYSLDDGVAVDPTSGTLVLTDSATGAIYAYPNGPTNARTTIRANGALAGIPVFRADGSLLYANESSGNIYTIANPLSNSPGAPTLFATGNAAAAYGAAVDTAGNAYFSSLVGPLKYVAAGASAGGAVTQLLASQAGFQMAIVP